ncbi:hypothetical protein BU14_0764s0002 [Porphyra umbilicalis]|uniref:Uncharacterized protein n=1 Tax=Porphyra umbilicalis TaxID=2786 RepID=A0A1X6NPF6_PORUM|nr:hypothetical protein BU14_0764s0002 [Porphyra umbilicalis]|eukprot:OSX70410.1 hypothetical protein BU14_0764s0002 [Porphyra umbilicalis]
MLSRQQESEKRHIAWVWCTRKLFKREFGPVKRLEVGLISGQ